MPIQNHMCQECMHKKMIESAIEAAEKMAAKMAADLPNAAPLDLLSKNAYQRMSQYLDRRYGPLREFIDENYVALLIAMSQYEEVDFRARIIAHIVHNIKNS